ncbi:hypothetical protein C4B63_60g167 [Trypanosoma cruzi]|uniref:Uncharacterized protein n=1 Tax=Trypanosoma cruzi TaxID=5693 RepID=A0A2V2UZA4_TRYCR|nr:hypothetical protein C4B63_60g167 [Trypanosoma cruzi]
MAGASIALENVDEALEANRRLQKKLKRMIRQLCEAHDQFSVLRVTLCMPSSSRRRERLSAKRASVHSAPVTYYFKDHLPSSSSFAPFRYAGVYAEGGIPRYAPLPLTADEVRWKEATETFSPLRHDVLNAAMRVEFSGKKEEGDDDTVNDYEFIAAVRGYIGNPCGATFWKALGGHGRPQFDIASRYVALRILKKINSVPSHCEAYQLSEEEKNAAAKEAVRRHFGDLGAMFAAYTELLVAAARRHAYMAELVGKVFDPFPPYVWESRINFMRMVDSIVQEAGISDGHDALWDGEDVVLAQRFVGQSQTKPSLVDLTACLLAFKSEILGKKSSLQEIARIFLPRCGGPSLTLWDLKQLRLPKES